MTAAPGPGTTRHARRPWVLTPVAIIAFLALAGAGPVVGASPDPGASPTPGPPGASVAPASPPASAPASDAPASPGGSPAPSVIPVRQGTIPAEGGILEPGDYQDWSLGPTLSFSVPAGWAATPVDAGFGLALVWGGQAVPGVLSFTQFEGLVFEDPCLARTVATLPIDRTPDALAGDIAQSPYLVVAEPVETEVGGFPALRLEIATQQPMGCDPPATWIWATPGGGGFVLEDGEQATLLLVTVGERVLVISWETYAGGDFEAFTTAAEAIVDTLAIDPSTDVPVASAAPDASPLASASPAAS